MYSCCFKLVRRFSNSKDSRASDSGLFTVDIEFLLLPYPNAIVLSPLILSIVSCANLVRFVLMAGIDVPEFTFGISFLFYAKYSKRIPLC